MGEDIHVYCVSVAESVCLCQAGLAVCRQPCVTESICLNIIGARVSAWHSSTTELNNTVRGSCCNCQLLPVMLELINLVFVSLSLLQVKKNA